jgi:phenylalanyl-tRNA synthetase alpha chain
MTERISELRAAGEAAIAEAPGSAELEEVRVRFLGRKAELPNLLRGVAQLEPAERATVGRAANEARRALEAAIEARAAELEAAELDARLAADVVDVSLPGSPAIEPGRIHLVTATRREIEDIFLGLGFRVMEGPEVELAYYNFDALNFDETHPSRQETDTFYVSDEVLLRVHTSPMQTRAMEMYTPPLYVVIPGSTYRRDNDATHSPQFQQVEGLAVDEDVTLGDLQGTLLAFARAYFGDDRRVRLRPHFFPFTEPSVECDVSCFNCTDGFLKDGSRCPLCKGEGWIEILGAGEVDPNVFEYVREYGYDPERHQGFAFGMGIERVAMLKHGVPDLRMLYDNDLRFLEQFG